MGASVLEKISKAAATRNSCFDDNLHACNIAHVRKEIRFEYSLIYVYVVSVS